MTPAAAQCAVHPQTTATRTCARCGNFMCNECSLGGSELNCPKCRALSGDTFPFTRDNHDFSRLWDYAFEAWKREWAMLSAAVVIMFVAAMGGGIIANVFTTIAQTIVGKGNTAAYATTAVLGAVFSQLLQQMVTGAMQMGLVRMVIDVLRGGKADVGRMFTQLSKLPTYIGQLMLVFLMVGLPTLLYFTVALVVAIKVGGVDLPSMDFASRSVQREWGEAFIKVMPIMGLATLIVIVPLTWAGLALTFIPMEIVYGNANAIDSIKRAFTIAKGFRFPMLGYWIVYSLVGTVGFFACCVGVLPATALGQLLLVSLFMSLRNGSGLPPPPEG